VSSAEDRRAWRDAAGRPVPPHSPQAVTQVPEVERTADQALALAQQLLDEGLPFYAHDVLEAAWKSAVDQERALWQGLAQVCVGLTHVQRGNPAGAARLLWRGAGRLAEAGAAAHGVRPEQVAAWALQAADLVERGAEPGPLRLRR
jgi:uncharacterized protein